MAPVRRIRRRDCRGTTHDARARERAPLSPSGVVSEAQIRPVEPTRAAVSHREDGSWGECWSGEPVGGTSHRGKYLLEGSIIRKRGVFRARFRFSVCGSFRTENDSDDSRCLSSRPSSLPRRRIAEFNRQAVAPRGSCKPKAPLRRSKRRAAAWGNRDDARLRARTARGVRFCSRGRARREWSLAPRVE